MRAAGSALAGISFVVVTFQEYSAGVFEGKRVEKGGTVASGGGLGFSDGAKRSGFARSWFIRATGSALAGISFVVVTFQEYSAGVFEGKRVEKGGTVASGGGLGFSDGAKRSGFAPSRDSRPCG